LCLDVNRAIPILVPASPSSEADVFIELVGTEPFPSPLEPQEEWYASPQLDVFGEPNLTIGSVHTPDGERFVQLRFGGNVKFAEFTVSADARHIRASWKQDARFEDIAWLLFRPVMSMVLWLRGITCLHASVVAVKGYAVAFVGRNGAGKSSVAAEFARNGFAVLADDVAVLLDARDRVLVQPTYPTLALAQQTALALLGSADLPPLWAGEDKRYVAMSADPDPGGYRFQSEPLPLAAIYFLGRRHRRDAPPLIERIAPADGLVRLLANRFLRGFADKERRIRQFELLGRVAQQVPLRTSHAPNDLGALSIVYKTILQDLALVLPRDASDPV
jgi:hypothetical protein